MLAKQHDQKSKETHVTTSKKNFKSFTKTKTLPPIKPNDTNPGSKSN